MKLSIFLLSLSILIVANSQISGSNYYSIRHPFNNYYGLEIPPASPYLQQSQQIYSDNQDWNLWRILEIDSAAPKKYLIYNRFFKRALTAENETSLLTGFIFHRTDYLKDNQLWEIELLPTGVFYFKNVKFPSSRVISPLAAINGIPWELGPTGIFDVHLFMHGSITEEFDSSYPNKLLKWWNARKAVDIFPGENLVKIFDEYQTSYQTFYFTPGTCRGNAAYKIRNGNNLYIYSNTKNQLRGGLVFFNSDYLWWYITPAPDYHNLAYIIKNCVSEWYLTLPFSNNNNALLSLSMYSGGDEFFFIRRII